MTTLNLHTPYFLPSTIGFDRIFDMIGDLEVKKPQSYPPYNIVRFDEDNYQIQIAVAGFEPSDLDIEVKENQLTVNGASSSTEQGEFLHHGLASRDFSHTFRLSDTVVVKTADVVNGVLKIDLENVIPEEKKPRKINIGLPPLLSDKK
jgi:molecular chaperone IbpA